MLRRTVRGQAIQHLLGYVLEQVVRLRGIERQLGMGVGLVCYGLYMLMRRPARLGSGPSPTADALAGALGGLTGPLAAFPGAGVTIWCSMRGWDKVGQRAVYQPYILLMSTSAPRACL